MKINPEKYLECCGVANFSIDWDNTTVELCSTHEYVQAGRGLGLGISPFSYCFNAYGWKWLHGGYSRK